MRLLPDPRYAVAPSPAVLAQVGDLLDPVTLLAPAELGRLHALRRPGDREDFVAARALARLLLCEAQGLSPTAAALRGLTFTQRCATCGAPHGRPVCDQHPGVGVSWSHSTGQVAVALAAGPVGVDLEQVAAVTQHLGTRSRPDGSAPGDPVRGALAWARAEALVKWGHGDLDAALRWSLDDPPAPGGRVHEVRAGDGTRPVPATAATPPGRRVVLTDVELPTLGAVCVVAGSGVAAVSPWAAPAAPWRTTSR